MIVRVGFTPRDEVAAPVGVVIDVLRATSTICQAFAGGFERVVCAGEVDGARALAGDGVALGGERNNVRPEGFDYGNSPREFAGGPATHTTLVLTTTNGTRLLLAAAARCESVLVGSLLNLDAVVRTVLESGASEVALLCAGVEGAFAIDDAYAAGHPHFPNRTNVSFVKAVDEHTIDVRFWERGAGETMSSGTGSTGRPRWQWRAAG